MEHVNDTISLPIGFRLLPGEELRAVIPHAPREFEHTPSSLEQIMRLTRSPSPNLIGANGPSVASLAFDVSLSTSVPPDQSPLNTPSSTSAILAPAPEHLRLYEVVFGRDSLRVAIDLISSYPELARATVLRLAELQGIETDIARDEEPGEIVHEARDENDPLAMGLTERLGWGWPYYGSVDATPEFIRTLTAYCRLSEENSAFLSETYIDRSKKQRSIAYALDMAIEWIIRKLDSNPEGLLEYKATLPKGIENQVWKDSWDAYHHADGTLANHGKGIASIEVQTTTYDALLDAAYLYENALDDPAKAMSLRARAAELKKTILSVFWTEDNGGYFVLGTDRDHNNNLRPLKIRTSNMGHVLNSRLLESDEPHTIRMREAVVRHITSPELLTSHGIRTLASDEVRFRPGAYHNGSIWLWDTHHIAKGLRRQGYGDIADEIDRRLLNVIEVTKIFPEYIRGTDNGTPEINMHTIVLWDSVVQRENQIEQPPQEVQAWTVAAILAIKKRLARRGIFTDQQSAQKN
ncbi:MAG: amylo-alpha-1,6-glucosidase [Candidatus Saccharimonadales bacterium]